MRLGSGPRENLLPFAAALGFHYLFEVQRSCVPLNILPTMKKIALYC